MQLYGITLTDALLALLFAAVVWHGLTTRHWLRRISGRLNRLPQRVSAKTPTSTYYAADEP
jgi:hypothetical protein